MPHEVDAQVDARQTQTGIQDRVAKGPGRAEARDLEEVRAVAYDEPRPGAHLAHDDAVAEERAPELGPAVLVQGPDGAGSALLLLDAPDHLDPLQLQPVRRQGATPQHLEGPPRLLHPAPVDEVPRRLGDEQQPRGQHRRHDEEGAHGDLVAGAVEARLRGVGHDRADDAADVDPLGEQGDHDGAQVRRAGLGRVDVGKGHQEAVADAQDEAAQVDDALVRGADLDGAAGGGQEAGEPEGRLAPEEVGEAPCSQGGEEGPEGEEGAYELLESSLCYLSALGMLPHLITESRKQH